MGSMDMDASAPSILRRPDGRKLAWTENGARDGRPVLVLHGSPGCRLSRHGDSARLDALGIRQISYDRPGYGASDPLPGRNVRDAVDDIQAVLDAAGVERAGIIGTSGGGPHALAVATALASRATLVYCNVGVAPRHLLSDDEFFAGMDRENVRRFKSAIQPRDQVHREFTAELDEAIAAFQANPSSMLGRMQLPEADGRIMREHSVGIATTMLEALSRGYWGFVDDFAAITRDWGFDPRLAEVPVIIEYGLQDVNVPPGHGRWLAAHIPGATAIVHPAGHLSEPCRMLRRLETVAAAGR
jgi:pimeloyl-ACP methyl ester carboxylesterase